MCVVSFTLHTLQFVQASAEQKMWDAADMAWCPCWCCFCSFAVGWVFRARRRLVVYRRVPVSAWHGAQPCWRSMETAAFNGQLPAVSWWIQTTAWWRRRRRTRASALTAENLWIVTLDFVLDGGGEHWLVQMKWRPAGWSVSASVNLPLHQKI